MIQNTSARPWDCHALYHIMQANLSHLNPNLDLRITYDRKRLHNFKWKTIILSTYIRFVFFQNWWIITYINKIMFVSSSIKPIIASSCDYWFSNRRNQRKKLHICTYILQHWQMPSFHPNAHCLWNPIQSEKSSAINNQSLNDLHVTWLGLYISSGEYTLRVEPYHFTFSLQNY